ncbi:AMP-binding protein, partial [Synergistaceae bacterium OttesenSCG-928-I11]|nr:AMP-binding protein [Synergistaceae bacterium OttesenSCG-928-I11]
MPNVFAKLYLDLNYKPEIQMESLARARAAGKVVIAPHHASYLDPILFGVYAPGNPLVVVSPFLVRQKWFNRFKDCFRYTALDLNDPFALKQLMQLIEENDNLVVFPEPEPTTSGLLQKISDTVVTALEKTGVTVVPARACNTQFTKYSRMGGRLAARRRPRIALFSWEPQKLGASGPTRTARGKAHLQLEQMLMDTMMQSVWDKKPIFDTLLDMRRLWGGKHVMGIEPDGARVDWNDFIIRVTLMSHVFQTITEPGERLGIMLPNTVMTLAAIIGAQHADRVPAMINYSMGSRALLAAGAVARVKKIVTSRRFVDEGKFQPLVDALTDGGLQIVYLEDLIGIVPKNQLLRIALSATFAKPTPDAAERAKRTALVLFTSGSEGTPKAVALSHLNIQANTAQVRTTLDFYKTDVMMAVLPMFHSFGLCTGTFMPLSTGMAIAFYPTPLHYKKIPQYTYEAKGTVLLGTNAFLAGYAKSGDPFDFFEMRYVICGGDKLKESTARLWYDKYGVRVLEGYGVTECTPVVGVNRLGRAKAGSIGRPLPCIDVSLTPVEGVEGAGKLVVKGPNLMLGYIQPDDSLLPPPENGYDTGDIVSIDEDGFITIQGRAKRFAKIGGEMVSLAHIEEVVQEVWPDEAHAVVSVPDENRGEIIVMLTERPTPDRDELRTALTKKGLPELAIPKKLIPVEAIPKIGVGKI